MNPIYVSVICVYLCIKPTVASSCETITTPLCAEHIAYNHTHFPNIFNHETQEEAGMEVQQFWPLVELQCSAALRHFLCLVYIPVCNIANLLAPPCKELCEESVKGCGDVMHQYGFIWPERLSCDQYPSVAEKELCIMPDLPRHSTNAAAEETEPIEEVPVVDVAEPNCEVIKSTFCAGHIPYNTTTFPNILNHPNQREAAQELEMYFPLVEMECSSPLLRLFVCSAYNPYCAESSGGVVIPPCRELCEQATTGCTGFDNQFGFVWPRYMRCERFPAQKDQAICVMPTHFQPSIEVTTETAPEVEEDLSGKNVSILELITVFRERVNQINQSMRAVRTENSHLQNENQELRKEVAALREELAASKGVTAAKMDKFENSISEKLSELKITIYNSLTTARENISQQIQQSCEN